MGSRSIWAIKNSALLIFWSSSKSSRSNWFRPVASSLTARTSESWAEGWNWFDDWLSWFGPLPEVSNIWTILVSSLIFLSFSWSWNCKYDLFFEMLASLSLSFLRVCLSISSRRICSMSCYSWTSRWISRSSMLSSRSSSSSQSASSRLFYFICMDSEAFEFLMSPA